MDRFFDANNPLMRALSGIVDLAIINLLTLICALPVVTAGASLTAMNYVLIHKVRQEETYLGKMFFHSFRDNLKQGILLGLIYLLLALIAGVDLYVLRTLDTKMTTALMIVLTVISGIIFVTGIYAFALLSRYENTLRGTLRNAVNLTVAHLPASLGMLLIWAVWIFVLWYLPRATVLFIVLFGISLPAYLCTLIYDPIFRKMESNDE